MILHKHTPPACTKSQLESSKQLVLQSGT